MSCVVFSKQILDAIIVLPNVNGSVLLFNDLGIFTNQQHQ